MRIGIVTAMAQETLPLYAKLGNVVAHSVIAGVNIRKIALDNDVIYLATSGVGEIKAALAVQLLKDLFDVEAVVNFGFVGALSHKLDISELVIARRVCHYQFDTSALDGTAVGQYDDKDDIWLYLDASMIDRTLAAVGKSLRLVDVASADVFVAGQQKEELTKRFDAQICDMELAGLAIACERNRLPLLSIKVVSDKADGSAPESFSRVVSRGVAKYDEILPQVIAAVTGNVVPLPPVKA